MFIVTEYAALNNYSHGETVSSLFPEEAWQSG